jgi:phosphate transport system protein
MVRHVEEEFQALAQDLLKMGGHCERMIQASVKALLERDLAHSAQVLKWEEQVNDLHIQIDDQCMHLLALQNPVASDLRAVIAALKINNDLERIGDQACNITQNTMDLLKSSGLRLPEELARMTELAQSMVRIALDAYVKRDADLAQHVLALEDQVDRLKDQVFQAELVQMTKNSLVVPRGLDIILIARNLEKIGDHATNIAEDVIFMVKAKDIRHHRQQEPLEA